MAKRNYLNKTLSNKLENIFIVKEKEVYTIWLAFLVKLNWVQAGSVLFFVDLS